MIVDELDDVGQEPELIYDLLEDYVPDGAERIYLQRHLARLIESTMATLPEGSSVDFRRTEDIRFAPSGMKHVESWSCAVTTGIPNGGPIYATAHGAESPLEAFDHCMSQVRKQQLTHSVTSRAGEMAVAV